MINHNDLHDLLSYNPDNGVFHWRRDIYRVKAGDVAGTINRRGYVIIKIRGRLYAAHRLAFLYINGFIPTSEIDHVNGVKTDNRWCNIRACSSSENKWNTGKRKNNSTGYKGVTFQKRNGTYQFQIMVHGRIISGSGFADPISAHEAYCKAAKKLHGAFSRTS